MAANYDRPKPIDQVQWRRNCIMRVRCGCGRQAEALVRDLMDMLRLPGDTRLYQVIDRLRCSDCGSRPSSAEVFLPGRRR